MTDIAYSRPRIYAATIVSRTVDIVVGVIELLLALRIIFEFLGANAGATFIAWMYQVSDGLLAPFRGAFPSISVGGAGFIDLSAILGMIAYLILGWLVGKLIAFVLAGL